MSSDDRWTPTLGAIARPDGTTSFRVWAPYLESLTLELLDDQERLVPMRRDAAGYFSTVTQAPPGTRYWLRAADGTTFPDPASRYQPEGVHGPSQVISPDFAWTDAGWNNLPLSEYILYELHVGTFTPAGTFDAVIDHLDTLRALGITGIEIMPVAQFPGSRNWGYDGVDLFAVQNSYGGPDGLKRLVNACHNQGVAVVLDVVYNHFGPEGNFLSQLGPYFTNRYQTPWGDALNFDGPQSDHVRQFFIENALGWITEFHVDGLRLDATHALYDFSALTFLEELVAAVHQQADRLNRRVHVIAENDRSDDRLLRPVEQGGAGLDAQWSDDLHHVVHTLLTQETAGYYADFGRFPQLVKVLRSGFVYSGEFSTFRERRHGTFRSDIPASKFIVCSQNHDQVGNRMNGDRLGHLVPLDALKLAASLVLLAPYVPLLFMGEEYAEAAPFLYFTSMEDPAIGAAVSEGRRREFANYEWRGEAPDPQDPETFERSKLNHTLRDQGDHRELQAYYAALIALRKRLPALRNLDKDQQEVTGYERQRVLHVHRWHGENAVVMIFNFNDQSVALDLPVPCGQWQRVLYSADARWQPDAESGGHVPVTLDPAGPVRLTLPPYAAAVYSNTARA